MNPKEMQRFDERLRRRLAERAKLPVGLAAAMGWLHG